MHRHAGYPYQQPSTGTTTHRYSGTSSAFSASANPNEDWTKISDLAERRRIQNRIAQRNYRKKLKKRLEDLERRAASNSASPEQRPAELERSPQHQDDYASSDISIESIEKSDSRRTPDMMYNNQYLAPHDDRNIYPDTRQLSTSPPPPFAYSTYPQEPIYAPYSNTASYQPVSTSVSDMPLFAPYLPPLSSNYPATLPSMVYPTKQEFFAGDEMSPFSMSYASMAGIDIPATTYQDSNPQTPPLSESFDQSSSGSPPDSTSNFPATPASSTRGTTPVQII